MGDTDRRICPDLSGVRPDGSFFQPAFSFYQGLTLSSSRFLEGLLTRRSMRGVLTRIRVPVFDVEIGAKFREKKLPIPVRFDHGTWIFRRDDG